MKIKFGSHGAQVVWALPAPLFEQSQIGSSCLAPASTVDGCGLSELELVPALKDIALAGPAADLGGLIFFRVVNAAPEKKHLVEPATTCEHGPPWP